MVKLMVKCKMLLCVQVSSLSKQTLSNELEENMNLHALRNYFVHLHLKNLRGGCKKVNFVRNLHQNTNYKYQIFNVYPVEKRLSKFWQNCNKFISQICILSKPLSWEHQHTGNKFLAGRQSRRNSYIQKRYLYLDPKILPFCGR